MPASINPPLVVVSIAPPRYSHSLIEKTGEFVLNIPTMEILNEMFFCGRRSGRNIDKFNETGLTRLPARKVKPPIIKECVAHLECKLYKQVPTGDHTLFIGEVLAAYVNENTFNQTYNLEKASLIYHVGGKYFATITPKIMVPET
jgi:flavin reductase (DIM6/NTAB) family NADH-FMN oxidoreductase RutF